MSTKSGSQFIPYWGQVADPTELPNVAGAAIQDAAVEAGDTAYSLSDAKIYTCTTPTVGAAVWAAGSTVDHNATLNQTVGIGHTQYVALAGRAGGQSQYGGTAAGEGATIKSTSHGTKGPVTISEATRVKLESVDFQLDEGSETNLVRRHVQSVSIGGWTTVKTLTPSGVAGVYAIGTIEVKVRGVRFTAGYWFGTNDALWYFQINNAAPTVSTVRADISNGSAPGVRLNVSGNDIQIQVQSSDGFSTMEGFVDIEVIAPEDYAGGLTYTFA